jgi:mono/diheme cytochrome c family protein
MVRPFGFLALLWVASLLPFPPGGKSPPGGEGQERTEGSPSLVGALGCGACHEGVPSAESMETAAPILGAHTRPLPPEYVFRYLAEPEQVRADIAPARMPTFPLSEEERLALALFLSSPSTSRSQDPVLQDALARYPGVGPAQGRELFGSLNCAGCHTHAGFMPRKAAPDLSRAGDRLQETWLFAFLAAPTPVRPAGSPPGSGSRMPEFRLTDEELRSVVASVASLRPPEPPPTPLPTEPLTPFSMARAELLLREELPCLGCHGLGWEGGRIGPPLDGVGRRLKPPAIRAIIQEPASAVPGSLMPRTPLTKERLDLVTAFLIQRPGAWTGSDRVSVSMGYEEGTEDDSPAALYRRNCSHCHGLAGGGDGYNAPFLPVPPTAHLDSAYMSTRSDDTLFDGIHAGGRILDRNHRMPSFGQALSREEIRLLVGEMRRLCRCQEPS